MVDSGLALGILQLVALALPAYAILIEIIVESEFPLANLAVPVVSVSFSLIIAGGIIVILLLAAGEVSIGVRITLLILALGLVGMIGGIGLIGLRTKRAQHSAVD